MTDVQAPPSFPKVRFFNSPFLALVSLLMMEEAMELEVLPSVSVRASLLVPERLELRLALLLSFFGLLRGMVLDQMLLDE